MKKLFVLLFVMILCFAAFSETRMYREKTGEKTVDLTVVHRPLPSGLNIVATVGTDPAVEIQSYTLDSSWATIGWEFDRPAENTRIRAGRQGARIVLSGLYKGRSVRKEFDAGSLPWNQAFQLGLEKFAAEAGRPRKFWAIGTSGPVAMRIEKFSAEIEQEEPVRIDGKAVPARHVRLSLAGLKSVFWHGDYWFRKEDGAFLRYEGKSGIGVPVSVMILIAEKPE